MMQQKSLTILAWLALTLSALFAAPAMADDIGGSKKLGLGIAGGYYSNVLTAKYYLQDKAAIQGLTFDRIGNFLTASGVCSSGGEVDAAVGRAKLGEADVRWCAVG